MEQYALDRFAHADVIVDQQDGLSRGGGFRGRSSCGDAIERGQLNFDARAVPEFALNFDRAPGFGYHALHCGEPEASAVSGGLGSEEWFKEVGTARFGPAAAVVLEQKRDGG